MDILVIDVGGSHVKLLATGQPEPRKFRSGGGLTAGECARRVLDATRGWGYEAVTLGAPAPVGGKGVLAEPANLGGGWVGFDFAAAFKRPVKVVNDAVMQALGSYRGGRMLFLGLGTGLGSALVADKAIVPLDLGQLPCREAALAEWLSKEGLKRHGLRAWREVLGDVVPRLLRAFLADEVVLGGGNAKEVEPLPEGARRGGNENAFEGGFRLWEREGEALEDDHPAREVWRMVY